MKQPRIIASEYLSRFQSGESRDSLEKWLESECAAYSFPDGVRQTIDTYLHSMHNHAAAELLAGYIERLERGDSTEDLVKFVESRSKEYPDPDLIKQLMRPSLRTYLHSRRGVDKVNDLVDQARAAG